MRQEATVKSRQTTDGITRLIDPLLPPARRSAGLSQKAFWVLLSTPGVTCVLTGMRTRHYVQDALDVLRWDPLGEVRPVYEALRSRL
jgi:aryl-alcohol dehydrogenase-like predicted oxidoreductase